MPRRSRAGRVLLTVTRGESLRDVTPLALEKIVFQDPVEERFDAMQQRNREVRDRVLMDYALLQAFSRLPRLKAADMRLIEEGYGRAFEKQLWLLVLTTRAAQTTVLLTPKLLVDYRCEGDLSSCVDGAARRFSEHTLSADQAALPVKLYGKQFQLTFALTDQGDGITENGWIVDDVEVLRP